MLLLRDGNTIENYLIYKHSKKPEKYIVLLKTNKEKKSYHIHIF